MNCLSLHSSVADIEIKIPRDKQFIFKVIPKANGREIGTGDREGKTAEAVLSSRLSQWATEV